MTTTAKGGKPYRCSFCGKSQDQVRKLIAGQGVYICDECITLCREIIDEEFLETPKARTLGAKVPSPRRNNEILARHTGQPVDKIARDTDRDRFMGPEEAKDYGIIDAVYTVPVASLIAKAHDAGLAGGEGSIVTEPADAGSPEAEQQQHRKSKS